MPKMFDRDTGIQAIQDLGAANGQPKSAGQATAEWDGMSTRQREFTTRAREALQSPPAGSPATPAPSPRPAPAAPGATVPGIIRPNRK